MHKNFTLSQLASFTREEQKLLSELGFSETGTETPSEQSVQHILNYSKVLSIRKSSTLEYVKMILN